MAQASLSTVISHWYNSVENLQASPMDFYASLEKAINKRNLPDITISRKDWKEGGMFSAKREYFRIKRKEHVFDICGAPFGNGFFFSWWLAEIPSGLMAVLSEIPWVGLFFMVFIKPATYYKIDTALMFQQAIHTAVLDVVDEMTSSRGLRTLSELERKPIMREFSRR